MTDQMDFLFEPEVIPLREVGRAAEAALDDGHVLEAEKIVVEGIREGGEVARKLAFHENPYIRRFAAGVSGITPQLASEILRRRDRMLAEELIHNDSLDGAVFEDALEWMDKWLLHSLIKRRGTLTPAIVDFFSQREEHVFLTEYFSRTDVPRERFEAALNNPNCPFELLQEIAGNHTLPYDLALGLLVRPAPLLRGMVLRGTQFAAKDLEGLDVEDANIALAIVRQDNTPRKMLLGLTRHHRSLEVRVALALREDLPPETVSALAKDSRSDVRTRIARRKDLPLEVVWGLLHDKAPVVRQTLLIEGGLPTEFVKTQILQGELGMKEILKSRVEMENTDRAKLYCFTSRRELIDSAKDTAHRGGWWKPILPWEVGYVLGLSQSANFRRQGRGQGAINPGLAAEVKSYKAISRQAGGTLRFLPGTEASADFLRWMVKEAGRKLDRARDWDEIRDLDGEADYYAWRKAGDELWQINLSMQRRGEYVDGKSVVTRVKLPEACDGWFRVSGEGTLDDKERFLVCGPYIADDNDFGWWCGFTEKASVLRRGPNGFIPQGKFARGEELGEGEQLEANLVGTAIIQHGVLALWESGGAKVGWTWEETAGGIPPTRTLGKSDLISEAIQSIFGPLEMQTRLEGKSGLSL